MPLRHEAKIAGFLGIELKKSIPDRQQGVHFKNRTKSAPYHSTLYYIGVPSVREGLKGQGVEL